MVREATEAARPVTDKRHPVTRTCPRCDGSGEVILNSSYYRDPQCEYPVMCSMCLGDGEVDLEDEDD